MYSFSNPIRIFLRLISDPNPDGNENVSTKQFLTISLSVFAGTDNFPLVILNSSSNPDPELLKGSGSGRANSSDSNWNRV
jgi:hypothetical protein